MRISTPTGRHGDVKVLTFSLDYEAALVLAKYAPPRLRARGRFISRLLFEFAAREEERAMLLHALQARQDARREECDCPLQQRQEAAPPNGRLADDEPAPR